MGGDEGQKNGLEASDLVPSGVLNFGGNPPTHCGGYGFGEGWINPTHTRTPGQPAERCDVSLTGETTNTKHTHKRSEAQ